MSTRREFIQQSAAATSLFIGAGAASAAIRKGPRIKSVYRRDETTVRHGGNGDVWHMTWAANGQQYTALCDGFGWSENRRGMYNSRLYTVSGGPHDARFAEVTNYPLLIPEPEAGPRYYGFGTLAIDRRIYQFLSTFNGEWSAGATDLRFIGAKLIYSPDNGRTWRNRDGSTPVTWETWAHRSPETMVFFAEPQETFSTLSILQMGRNYEANADGYIYVYGPNGNTEGTMNELVMFRAPADQLVYRDRYEYFAGLTAKGAALWSRALDERAVVHTFPAGWVNKNFHPWAWLPSITYNAPLGVYLMANWGPGVSAKGDWFAKPSYLGLWVAQWPWGPWTQIHEETAWTPNGEGGARAYAPQIAPAWLAPDGKSFWLVWSDMQARCDDGEYRQADETAKRMLDAGEGMLLRQRTSRRCAPYYAFNTQRFDLVVS